MAYVRRRRTDGVSQRASTLELFYDLVFVFAITQVSHLLLEHLTWAGAGQALIVLLAVWWSWNYTTWTTNELDTETIPVRLLLLSLMLVSLLMAVAIPDAFGEHALLFAGSYLAIQVGRHSFLAFAAAGPGTIERERAGRILTWFVAAGVLWIAGALADGPARATWDVGTEHFAERFGLFIILALGESIVLTGATTSESGLTPVRIVAFVMAFLASAAIWWLYFTSVARLGEHYLRISEDRTMLARDGYTFLHVVFAAGIILAAVGDELVIAHPTEVLPPQEVAAVAAGPAIYLFALTLFGYRLTGTLSKRKLFGTLGCVVIGFVGLFLPALVLAGLFILVLVAVIVSNYLLASRSRARGEASPIEQLEAEDALR
jgi:low temperature requirement protein LtrA